MKSARSRSKPRRAGTALAGVKPVSQAPVSPGDRAQMVALAAYYRAERRGFEPGRELEDWLEAEAEVDAALRTRQAAR